MPGGGEGAHVQADLSDDDLGGARSDPWDLVQARDGRQDRRAGSGTGVGAGAPIGVDTLCSGDRRDHLIDPGGEVVDLGGQGADLVQQDLGQLAVVVAELAGQGLHQRVVLDPQPALGQAGQSEGVTLPGDQRLDHGPPRDAHDVGGHAGDLDQGVLQQLRQSLDLAAAFAGDRGSVPGSDPAAGGSAPVARTTPGSARGRRAGPARRHRRRLLRTRK